MSLQELQYFAAVAEHLNFGKAAKACHVSQPTLSGQLRKLEEHLGVTLFERNNKRVTLTPIGEQILVHAKKPIHETGLVESVAKSSHGQLAGPLRLGVIPTIAPYLMPLVLGPLREQYPQMTIELWEDFTVSLIDLLRAHRLDAALVATELPGADLTSIDLFVEPFFAALPRNHRLAELEEVEESDLACDVLVLADGHCLSSQTLAACGRNAKQSSLQAASLDTLVNLVAAGYGTTLVPGLATGAMSSREVALRPLAGRASRTIRLVSRTSFPRPEALKAIEMVIRKALSNQKS